MGSAAASTTKKKQTVEEKADIRRVNLSFTAEEYELLENAARETSKDTAAGLPVERTPTGLAKALVMAGLQRLEGGK